jgi:FkbM family methyltransferase
VAFQLLEAFDWLQELDNFTSCEISWSSSLESVVFRWGNAKYIVKNAEEIFILREIYLFGDYDFAACSPCVIVDIGANVGFASIFLAAENPDAIILGYEPLKTNFDSAQRNVAQNPHLAARINFHNVGLFSATGKKRMQSEITNRGRSSIVIDRSAATRNEIEYSDIQVVKATDVITNVLKENPGKRVIAKMDCEGSEYEILRDLNESGALHNLSAIVMEWHELPEEPEGGDGLRKLLIHAGFDVCTPGRLQTRVGTGMILAFNTSNAAVTA